MNLLAWTNMTHKPEQCWQCDLCMAVPDSKKGWCYAKKKLVPRLEPRPRWCPLVHKEELFAEEMA